MSPKISVIMSVYNSEKYLELAIDSILNQTYKDFEFFIINDSSTDKSLEIIRSYAKKDKRIRIIENDRNIGLTRSLNKGIAAANGKYIARMDADDVSYKDRLIKQIEFLESNPEIGVLSTNIELIDREGNIIKKSSKNRTSSAVLKWRLFFGNSMTHPSLMMRKELINAVGGYDQVFNYSQDYNLMVRMMGKTNFARLDEVLLQYRIHSDKVSITHELMQMEMSAENSRIAISEVLGKEISLGQAKIIRGFLKGDDDELSKAIDIINNLYLTFTSTSNLTDQDRKSISEDAGVRAINLFKSLKTFKSKTIAFGNFLRIYPSFIKDRFIGKLRRIVQQ